MQRMNKIKVSDIPKGKFVKSLNNKQLRNFVIPFLIGFFMLFGNWQLKAFGLLFIAYTIFIFIKFKDRVVVDIYEEFFVAYDREDNSYVSVVFWNDIETWDLKISQIQEDSIFVENKNNELLVINMFGIGRLVVYFRRYVFEKNKNEKYKRQQNARGSSFNISGLFSGKKKGDD